MIKTLVEKIGVHPIGSLVELNTKETAEVVELDHSVHLRPVAKFRIIRDANGKELERTKVLDMIARSGIHVKKIVLKKKRIASPLPLPADPIDSAAQPLAATKKLQTTN